RCHHAPELINLLIPIRVEDQVKLVGLLVLGLWLRRSDGRSFGLNALGRHCSCPFRRLWLLLCLYRLLTLGRRDFQRNEGGSQQRAKDDEQPFQCCSTPFGTDLKRLNSSASLPQRSNTSFPSLSNSKNR